MNSAFIWIIMKIWSFPKKIRALSPPPKIFHVFDWYSSLLSKKAKMSIFNEKSFTFPKNLMSMSLWNSKLVHTLNLFTKLDNFQKFSYYPTKFRTDWNEFSLNGKHKRRRKLTTHNRVNFKIRFLSIETMARLNGRFKNGECGRCRVFFF